MTTPIPKNEKKRLEVLWQYEVLDTVPEYMRLVTRGAGTGIVWPALLRKMDRLDPGFRD